MKLSFEAKGLLSQIECMVGSTLPGHESGVLYGEDGQKLTKDEFLFLIGDGSDARDLEISKLLEQLCRARQLNARRFESGTIALTHWHDDQEVPASGDSERKRVAADDELKSEAEELHGPLVAWFKALGGRKVTDEEIDAFLRKRTGRYLKKRKSILQFLYDSGFLVQDSSALASLALPPSGVGVGGDSGVGGSGGEYSPAGNIPADQDQEPDQDKVSPLGNQLVPIGAGADTRPRLEGGKRERSEGGGFLPPGQQERPIPPPEEFEDFLYEPGDAFRVKDPIHATERLLSETQGWSVVSTEGRPNSQTALLAQYSALSRAHGPKMATAMWRECLRVQIADMVERRATRAAPPRSWTALFMSRVKNAKPVEVEVAR